MVSSNPTDEVAFVDGLFARVAARRAVLLFAQAERGSSAMASYLLARAQQRFGSAQVIHLVPPYSTQADLPAYYAALGEQCSLSTPVSSATSFGLALEREKLRAEQPTLVLVSRFEHTWAQGGEELAGVLRGLYERYPRLSLLVCGGEKLADLYYRDGTLSLLNIAEPQTWPELTVADVQRLQQHERPGAALSAHTAAQLLEISGGHPRLLQQCLELGPSDVAPDAATYQALLRQSQYLWHAFAPFRQEPATAQRLCTLLAQPTVGPADPYLFDALLRRLYWKNLLKPSPDGTQLVWRCEGLRLTGQHILGCEGRR